MVPLSPVTTLLQNSEGANGGRQDTGEEEATERGRR